MDNSAGALGVIQQLNESGYEAFLVGGCVRDMLMGMSPQDYDVCTSARPEETLAVFSSRPLVTAGVKHGTVGVPTDTGLVEVTTYRREGAYSDQRHPDNVVFVPDLREDLSRRDFTVNAMAMSATGELVDCFGGQEDLAKRMIRCVGNPNLRFEEDALRILRALRFASRLGFAVEEKTAEAIHQRAADLKAVAAERKWAELKGILQGASAVSVVREYLDVIRQILPGARVLPAGVSVDPMVRLAALLPAENAAEALKALRCEKKVLDAISILRDTPCPATEAEIRQLDARLGETRTRQILEYNGRDISGLSELLATSPCRSLDALAVNGRDLKQMGFAGPEIGRTLELLLNRVLALELPNEKTALCIFAKGLVETPKM